MIVSKSLEALTLTYALGSPYPLLQTVAEKSPHGISAQLVLPLPTGQVQYC